MNIIQRIQALNVDRSDINEMVELLAHGEVVARKFEALELPPPEALTDGLKTLTREVQRRSEDAIEARLKELAAADAADRTATERRHDRDAERNRLLSKLHKGKLEPMMAPSASADHDRSVTSGS